MHTPVKWVTCLRDYCLMPDPHSEEGAQEYVSLFKHQVSWDSAWPVSPDEGLQGPGNWVRIPGEKRQPRWPGLWLFGKCLGGTTVLSFLKAWEGSSLAHCLLGGSWAVSWGFPESLCVRVCVCQMLCDMARVLELRLILRQPSPLWLSFTVEELQIYQQGPKVSSSELLDGPFPRGS